MVDLILKGTVEKDMSEHGERRRIVDAVFKQKNDGFTASFIARAVEVNPRAVYETLDLMDCVEEDGSTQGKKAMVRAYRVTGKPPESCTTCLFNSIRATSCTRAPNHSDAAGTEEPTRAQRWKSYLQACAEARTGILTDDTGDLIPPVGYLEGH